MEQGINAKGMFAVMFPSCVRIACGSTDGDPRTGSKVEINVRLGQKTLLNPAHLTFPSPRPREEPISLAVEGVQDAWNVGDRLARGEKHASCELVDSNENSSGVLRQTTEYENLWHAKGYRQAEDQFSCSPGICIYFAFKRSPVAARKYLDVSSYHCQQWWQLLPPSLPPPRDDAHGCSDATTTVMSISGCCRDRQCSRFLPSHHHRHVQFDLVTGHDTRLLGIGAPQYLKVFNVNLYLITILCVDFQDCVEAEISGYSRVDTPHAEATAELTQTITAVMRRICVPRARICTEMTDIHLSCLHTGCLRCGTPEIAPTRQIGVRRARVFSRVGIAAADCLCSLSPPSRQVLLRPNFAERYSGNKPKINSQNFER
ncbi:hypothetical protein EDD85DRAFT_939353 [Armillaria nabsnona]|nr:hypothetical protein EDD85DRAFT_939353 [Armillaria nabsnona]